MDTGRSGFLSKALEGFAGVTGTEERALLRLAAAAPALGPRVIGGRHNPVCIGLLAVAETRDKRLTKAPPYSLEEFTHLVEGTFERGAAAADEASEELPKRGQPMPETERHRQANGRYNDLTKTLGDLKRFLSGPKDTRQYHLSDEVEVDLLQAADALRDAESRFVAAKSLTRADVEALLEEIAPNLEVVENAFVGDSRIPLPRPWLTHVAGALEATHLRALQLKIECLDRVQFEPARAQELLDLSETFLTMERPIEAMDAELRAVRREDELEALAPAVKSLVARLGDSEDGRKLRQRVRAVQSRLRVRYAAHELEGAANWVGREGLLAELEGFWRAGEGGIFALIGLGGGGKTALVRQVLSRNGWIHPPYPPDAPDGVFVWSFYHPVNFFDMTEAAIPFFERFVSSSARNALRGEGGDRLVDLLRLAARDHRLLFVLDGLETQQFREHSRQLPDDQNPHVARPRSRGDFKDIHMARFVRDLAGTGVPVFATSRVSLKGLSLENYEERDPSEMDLPSAIQLFREQVVGRSDEARAELASRLDRHVLTMSIVAHLLARHHRGDPNALYLLPDLPEHRNESGLERAVRKLGGVLAQVDQHLEPLELTLLGIVGSLAMPVPRYLLDDILISFSEASGRDEPKITQLSAALTVLEDRGLMFTVTSAEGMEMVSSHVLVRHYYELVLPEAERIGIREAAETSLATAADEIPRESALRLQVVVERLRQLAFLGRAEEAVAVYREQLGGYRGLGWQRGDHATGMELMTMLIDTIQASGGKPDFRLHMDLALYTKNAGLLEESAHVLQRARKAAPEARRVDVFQNLAGIHLLRGRLDQAWTEAQRAVEAVASSDDQSARREAYTRLADVAARVGEVEPALEAHSHVVAEYVSGSKFVQVPGHSIAWLYMMQRRPAEAADALRYSQDALDAVEDTAGAYGMLRARQHALRARLALLENDLKAAREFSELLSDWVHADSQDHEMIAAAALVSGLVAHASGKQKEAEARYTQARDVAAECGLGLYWIDALVRLAHVAANRSTEEALSLAILALAGQEPGVEGYALAGAASSEPGYRWGELHARELRAQLLPDPSERDDEARRATELAEILQIQVFDPER